MKEKMKMLGKNWVYALGIVLIAAFALLFANSNKVLEMQAKSEQANSTQTTQTTKSGTGNQAAASGAAKTTSTTKPSAQNAPAQTNDESKTTTATAQAAAAGNKQTVSVAKDAVAQTATVKIDGLGSYSVPLKSGDTGFDILGRASSQNGFPIDYKMYSFGPMITKIGSIAAEDHVTWGTYWALYYNGAYSDVGAGDLKINNNDVTEWRLETW